MRNRIALFAVLTALLFSFSFDVARGANDVFKEIRKSLMASGDQEALNALTVLERSPVFPALAKAIQKDPAVNKAFQAYLGGGQTDGQLDNLANVVKSRIRSLLAQSGDQAAIQASATLEKSPAFQKAIKDAFLKFINKMNM